MTDHKHLFRRPITLQVFGDEIVTRDQAYEEDYIGGSEFCVDEYCVEQDDELVRIGFSVVGLTSGFCYWAYQTLEEAEKKTNEMNEILVKKRGF